MPDTLHRGRLTLYNLKFEPIQCVSDTSRLKTRASLPPCHSPPKMASPTRRHKHKRLSLENAFDGLEISHSHSNRSPAQNVHLGKSIREMMKRSLRLERGTISRSVKGLETKLTISQDGFYDYKICHNDFDPDVIFPELLELLDNLQEFLKASPSPQQQAAFDTYILESLTHMVFGSNFIEKAGAGFEITWDLCMKIFKGEQVLDEVKERDPEYERIKADLLSANQPANYTAILRSRREIIQHAKAAAYMINSICLQDREISEEIILETHRILTYKVDAESMPWTQYSGVYRSVDVCVGFNTFAPVASIPRKMKNLVEDLQDELKEAGKTGTIDPIMLAAKYSHMFVHIHPFLDGNGRMCRLLLNSILLKFGNILVCLGGNASARNTYLEISSGACQMETTYEGREEEERPVIHKELASLVLSTAKASLGKLIRAVAK